MRFNFNRFIVLISLIISTSLSARTVSVMTYNLENLFDTKHDPGKKDWTYLPLSVKRNSPEAMAYCNGLSNEYYRNNCLTFDWNRRTFLKKIKNLGRVIKEFDAGQGPDILVVQEVENMNALKQLVRYGLRGQGYKSITLIEGPDSRGIDVGVISRFPVIKRKLHPVRLPRRVLNEEVMVVRNTRGILEVTYKIDGKTLTIFGNHWPSQRNSDHDRVAAAKVLMRVAKRSTSDVVMALGDFNTVESDRPHAFKQVLLNKRNSFHFVDVNNFVRANQKGTHFYDGKWSFLDKIFITNKSMDNFVPLWRSYKVNSPSYVLRDAEWVDRDTGHLVRYYDIPFRYDPETGEGFSDHLGAGFKFIL